ncbi:hypothetical protein TDIS_1545 [Thermosulfurimonas dismutans]|uniref:Uncharacterized protein n=1 Tax=Thermosulfurimonas dismutans TaxID=999894 RepID=A0A179D2P6_9BACT|nr:hypothetical protein TDIS_1545 [Thermosulfurimonas dismutans]
MEGERRKLSLFSFLKELLFTSLRKKRKKFPGFPLKPCLSRHWGYNFFLYPLRKNAKKV